MSAGRLPVSGDEVVMLNKGGMGGGGDADKGEVRGGGGGDADKGGMGGDG